MAARSGEAATGGQWNFSGVLYQLLTTLKSGLNAVVDQVAIEPDVASARIIVEPNDGGDAQVLQPGLRRVDQIKIRRGAAVWTTRSIVENVLPDLLKAAQASNIRSQYRFITDNLNGTSAFEGFIGTLRRLDAAGKNRADLDTLEQPFRWGTERISAERLFSRIVATLNAPESGVWQFLASVELVGWAEAAISAEIDEILAELVTEREEIPIKRKAMGLHLLSLGAVGASISTEALLRAVDLNPARLTHPRRLPSSLRTQVEEEARLLKYDHAMDVRERPILPDAPLSILSGDSGQGKTWRLCHAALATVAAGKCAMLLPAIGSLADIESKIVERVWLTDFDRSLPLVRIAERLRPKLAGNDNVWLTVFLDDLADPALAMELARMPWAYLGIRTVISAQSRIARMLGQTIEDLQEIAVPDFTLSELREYLRRAGRDPSLVPDDVLLSLLRPVLAAIYCRIPRSERWTAVNEYELMDRCWTWATTETREQALHTSDSFAVLRLAGTLLDGKPIYPWTPSVAHNCGLPETVCSRLITIGILRQDEHGALQLFHDRVLNWAVASEIARRFLEGELLAQGVADLFGRIDNISTLRGARIGRRLGYVLHDLLWKLTRDARPEEVGTLVLLLIQSGTGVAGSRTFLQRGIRKPRQIDHSGDIVVGPTTSFASRACDLAVFGECLHHRCGRRNI